MSAFSGVFLLAAMLFLGNLTAYLPRAALAAVLLIVAAGMIDGPAIRRIVRGACSTAAAKPKRNPWPSAAKPTPAASSTPTMPLTTWTRGRGIGQRDERLTMGTGSLDLDHKVPGMRYPA